MLYGDAIFIRDMLNHDHDALYETYGIRPKEAEQSLHYAELAELRAWGIDEMIEATLPGQSSSEERLRRRIALAMKAEGAPDHIHPGDAVLLLERSGLMLVGELRDAIICMCTRSYAEDGIDFSLEAQNRLRRLLGKPVFTDAEAQVWLADDMAKSNDEPAPVAAQSDNSPAPAIEIKDTDHQIDASKPSMESNVAPWALREPERYQGYAKPLYDVLKAAHDAGRCLPKARDVLDIWKNNKPPEVMEVLSDGIKYYDSSNNAKQIGVRSVQKTIDRLAQLAPDSPA